MRERGGGGNGRQERDREKKGRQDKTVLGAHLQSLFGYKFSLIHYFQIILRLLGPVNKTLHKDHERINQEGPNLTT